VFVGVDVEVEFSEFAEFPDSGAVVVSVEPAERFHFTEDATDGVAFAFVEREVADFELPCFSELYEHCIPCVVSECHGAYLTTKYDGISLSYLSFTMLSLYNRCSHAITEIHPYKTHPIYKRVMTRRTITITPPQLSMPVRTADGGDTPADTITYRSDTALTLAAEALQYAEGHWPDETTEYDTVAELHREVRDAIEHNGTIEIPVAHTPERRGLFLFALSLYSQWLRDASERDGWETPYDNPEKRAATVDQLAGPFEAHHAREQKRRQQEMRERLADLFK